MNRTGSLSKRLQSAAGRLWASFSFAGLAVGAMFFAASLTPSLLPRNFVVQGLLSGFALAVGYGTGVFVAWLCSYLEIPVPSESMRRVGKWLTVFAVALTATVFLWRATEWQNGIRRLMEMEPVESTYPATVALIALLTGVVLVTAARGLGVLWRFFDRLARRVVPRRVSNVASAALVIVILVLVVNKAFALLVLNTADRLAVRLDQAIDAGLVQPDDLLTSGSPQSLVPWETMGRFGKLFVSDGPTQETISRFWGREARRPLRVYVGLGAQETAQERAELALQELVRVGAFQRSVLVIATPTGTGWLDPGAVDTLEYLHCGDTAIVTMQYSYLPSWITILIDSDRSRDDARELFNVVYGHWKTLPNTGRPKLYLYGLSLGALGSADSADLFTVFEDPIQGAVWSGPPFASPVWSRAVRNRNPGSPMWLPRFRDGSLLRFTGRECSLDASGDRWGPMRFVFLQHASDPMCFISVDLLYRSPEWLVGGRGPDVSPDLAWYPMITFLQTLFDLPVSMAETVPPGFGHNYAASSYIDTWVAVTEPPGWSAEQTKRLKELFDPKPHTK